MPDLERRSSASFISSKLGGNAILLQANVNELEQVQLLFGQHDRPLFRLHFHLFYACSCFVSTNLGTGREQSPRSRGGLGSDGQVGQDLSGIAGAIVWRTDRERVCVRGQDSQERAVLTVKDGHAARSQLRARM